MLGSLLVGVPLRPALRWPSNSSRLSSTALDWAHANFKLALSQQWHHGLMMSQIAQI